jgi:hypothetical protein
MAISANYPTPVTVNGYQCRNCTDVDYAKKNIDPAHPKSGPFGADADLDPTVGPNDPKKIRAEAARAPQGATESAASSDPANGRFVNLLV